MAGLPVSVAVLHGWSTINRASSEGECRPQVLEHREMLHVATDEELAQACSTYIAKYKIPKAFIRVDKVLRSPSGKADYRWAKEVANAGVVPA